MNNLELSGAFLGRGSQPSPVSQSPHDHAEVKGQGLGSLTQSWASSCLEELGHEERFCFCLPKGEVGVFPMGWRATGAGGPAQCPLACLEIGPQTQLGLGRASQCIPASWQVLGVTSLPLFLLKTYSQGEEEEAGEGHALQ